MVEWWKEFQKKLTRETIEKYAAWAVGACALLALFSFIPWPFGRLSLDHGSMKYSGSIVHGKMNGNGTLRFKNGDVYQGHFVNGSFDGKGTYTAKEGWVYEGQFVKGQPEGKGKLTTEKNVIYEGTFKQGIYQK